MGELGETIRGAREASGLTRAQLAEKAGVSHVFIGKIEQGKRNPSPPTLFRIASALKLSAGELMTRAELLDASNATATDELTRRLIKAVTVSAGIRAVLPIIGLGPLAATAGAAALAYELARHQQPAARPEPPVITDSARQRLQALVGRLSEDEAEAVLSALTGDDQPA